MKIAVLGYGSQGKSTVQYHLAKNNTVVVYDANPDITVPKGIEVRSTDDLSSLGDFDHIYRTPIIHPTQILDNHPELSGKITSNTNEFFKVCPTKNIIGVTGTKGKGTSSTLIATMLKNSGNTVHLGGNIGTPPLDLLQNNIQPNDWVVLELANFQLIDIKHSPKIAVCLMVEPEHLDWHKDLDEYIAAKQQMFTYQAKDDIAIYYAQNDYSAKVASVSKAKKIPYMEPPGAYEKDGYIWIQDHKIISTKDLKLPGKHNWQNICAALTAVWEVSQDFTGIQKALKNFGALPFRIEKRRTVNSVSYYDDSFATGPGATVAAIEAIEDKKVLIIGGYDRGLSLEPLADCISEHKQDIRKVILVGASAGRVREILEDKGFSNYVEESSKDMETIVRTASKYAHSGDAVVLSPAFASFDMFKNFEERGIKFNQAVEKL